MNATTAVATTVIGGGVLAVAFLAIGSAKIAAVPPQMRERAAHLASVSRPTAESVPSRWPAQSVCSSGSYFR